MPSAIFHPDLRSVVPDRKSLSSISMVIFHSRVPNEVDEYRIKTREAVALALAEKVGIATAQHRLVEVAGKQSCCLHTSTATGHAHSVSIRDGDDE